MNYAYIAYDGENKVVNGSISALSEKAAGDRLTKMGFHVLSLKTVNPLNMDISKLFKSEAKVKSEQIVMFARQMATLMNAGVNLITSLELLQAQANNATFKEVLGKIILDVRSGHKLSDAASQFPAVFPSLFCRSLSVGEQSGELAKVISQSADYMEKNVNARKSVKSSLAYPAFMMVITVVVVFILINFVFPTFMGLYATMGAHIPTVTRYMLSVVNFIKVILPYFIGLIIIAVLGISLYIRRPSGRYNWDKFLLKLPMLGYIIQLQELSNNCRTMAMLFRSGLALAEILDVLVDSSSNSVVVESWKKVKQAVFKGEGLSGPMVESPVFLPMMVEMVKVGEETGEMDTTLMAVAQNYEAEADGRTKAFVGAIQPTMTLIIGLIVFLIVVSMVSLMYSIYGQISP